MNIYIVSLAFAKVEGDTSSILMGDVMVNAGNYSQYQTRYGDIWWVDVFKCLCVYVCISERGEINPMLSPIPGYEFTASVWPLHCLNNNLINPIFISFCELGRQAGRVWGRTGNAGRKYWGGRGRKPNMRVRIWKEFNLPCEWEKGVWSGETGEKFKSYNISQEDGLVDKEKKVVMVKSERDSKLSLYMMLKKSTPRLLVGYRWSEF